MAKEKSQLSHNSGFTIIEALIAIFAFGIIFTIIGSIFAQSLLLQRRAFNAQKVEENLNLIMEAMAREIRVSTIIGVDTVCPSAPLNLLTIIHPVNGNVNYTLNNFAVHRNMNADDSIMSSNTVRFTRLQFCLSGMTPGSQPRVTVVGTIQSLDINQQITEDFQTTITTRVLNP